MTGLASARRAGRSVLRVAEPTAPVRAVALVLHGGRAKGRTPVRAWQLAVLRMLPFARALQGSGGADGLAVARLRYAVRGWNGAARSPVPDAAAALDDLAARYPGVPVLLIGHSMGARTALYVAGHPAVRGVVGLAPWIEPGDPVDTLAQRQVLLVHGDRDRTTDPRATRAYAERAAARAASLGAVTVTGDGHPMLRRAGTWTDLVVGFAGAVLLGRAPAAVTASALAGRTDLVV